LRSRIKLCVSAFKHFSKQSQNKSQQKLELKTGESIFSDGFLLHTFVNTIQNASTKVVEESKNRKPTMNFRITLFLIIAIFLAACRQPQTNDSDADANNQNQIEDITPPQSGDARRIDFPQNKVELPQAIRISNDAQDIELSRQINEIIEKSSFRNARWGVFVTSLKDGRVLVARDAQNLFNPASTLKIFTTAVALDKLGSNFRWKTSILSEKQINADGALEGDLILYGRGAPDFDERGIAALVEQLKQKGLKQISGKIIGDASYFHGNNLGSGWIWDEAQWYYGAEPSALSYSDNTVLVEIEPNRKIGEAATIKTTPDAPFVSINNNTRTESNANKQTIGVHRDLDSNNLQIWGAVPPGKAFAVRTTMHAPQLWAANALKKNLERAGIKIAGEIASRDWKNADLNLQNYKELASIESDTLAEIVKRTNKRSINLNAELILRTLGRRERETADKEKLIMLGDDALGALVVTNWLAAKGVATNGQEIHDGSGLSRLDFVSPEATGRLLVHAAQMPEAQAFKDSLPVAGVDGTLGGRLTKFKDKIFAKTGTITYVNTLAGYAQISDDETLAFVIFCNNQTSKQNSVNTVDAVASLIADFPKESIQKNQSKIKN
jgi:D-alanyl-D-alanine carboxypeptidase/D-alanyl-D-alanine-endopeptidase (penicillin-binding protein 4)